MTKLYAYSFNTDNNTMKDAEVEVNETEKQYSVDKSGRPLTFLYKHKLLKSEIGKLNNDWSTLTVYLTEKDAAKARRIIFEYVKARLEEHKKQAAKYQASVDALAGGGADV